MHYLQFIVFCYIGKYVMLLGVHDGVFKFLVYEKDFSYVAVVCPRML